MIVVEFKGESKEFAAEEISSMVLIKMCVHPPRRAARCAPRLRAR
jgi:hypothetical protein